MLYIYSITKAKSLPRHSPPNKKEGHQHMHLYISNSGEQPIYEQITSQIKNHILSGELTPGEALPSLRLLAKELRVSIISTKRAYEELEREGFIQSVPGKGSFVAPQNIELIREEKLRQAEERVREAVDIARSSGITLEELKIILEELYAGDI